ncbi:MAG TPA: DUF6184 family natural product biosynthesis lipoprotein [Myxococcaceae bacterium]|nr:DUF6184 family natural product biosynthesis lipoprotein [Myxococcaceae bacterium]
MNFKAWTCGLVLAVAGCDDEVADITDRQSDAVKAAVDASCDRYEECNKIGTAQDAVYATRDECEVETRDFWNSQWPAAECEGKINGDGLSTCTDRIKTTDCDNFIDQLTTAYQTCNREDVCR